MVSKAGAIRFSNDKLSVEPWKMLVSKMPSRCHQACRLAGFCASCEPVYAVAIHDLLRFYLVISSFWAWKENCQEMPKSSKGMTILEAFSLLRKLFWSAFQRFPVDLPINCTIVLNRLSPRKYTGFEMWNSELAVKLHLPYLIPSWPAIAWTHKRYPRLSASSCCWLHRAQYRLQLTS